MSLILKHLQPKLHALTNGLFANWLPDNAVAVGDFGILNNGAFERRGSLADYGIAIDAKPTKSDGKSEFEYKDKIDLSVNMLAEANAAPKQGAKVAVTIRGKGAFLYHISDVTQVRPVNQRTFEEDVAKVMLGTSFSWEDEFVLVTEIQHASKATIIASESSEGRLELNTSFNPTGTAFLSGAKGGISVGSSFGSMFSWIARGNTITLLKLVRPIAPPPPGKPQAGSMKQVIDWAKKAFQERQLNVATLVIRHVEKPDPTVVVSIGPHALHLAFQAVTVEDLVSTVAGIEREKIKDSEPVELEVERKVFGGSAMTG